MEQGGTAAAAGALSVCPSRPPLACPVCVGTCCLCIASWPSGAGSACLLNTLPFLCKTAGLACAAQHTLPLSCASTSHFKSAGQLTEACSSRKLASLAVASSCLHCGVHLISMVCPARNP